MAGEAGKDSPGDGPHERNPTGAVSDSVDSMVSGFLEELTDISSETKQVSRPDIYEDSEILPAAEPAGINQAQPSDEAIRAESELIFGEIRDEVEETLIKLEHRNSQTIPAADQREATEKPPSSFPMEEEQLLSEFPSPMAAEPDASQSVAEPPLPPPSDGEDEEMWKFLKVLRAANTYSSPGFCRRHKHLIFASTGLALILAIGGLYFLWAERITPVSEAFGQIQNPSRQRVRDSEKQTSRILPPLDSSNAALADEPKDAATAPPAKAIRLPQKTSATGPLIEESVEEKPEAPASPVSNGKRAGGGFYKAPRRVIWVEISSESSESESGAQEQANQRTAVPEAVRDSPASKPQVSQGITSAERTASQSVPDTMDPSMRPPASSGSATRDPADPSSTRGP